MRLIGYLGFCVLAFVAFLPVESCGFKGPPSPYFLVKPDAEDIEILPGPSVSPSPFVSVSPSPASAYKRKKR